MTSAQHVAALVIQEQGSADRQVDKMQLQKLLYLIDGTHLELWGTPAFSDPIQAYRNGPVVPSVEATYRTVAPGRAPIPAPVGGDPAKVPASVREVVVLVLERFGSWPGPRLEKFTKLPQSPWRVARGDVPDGAESNMDIPRAEIARWFRRRGSQPNPPKLSARDREAFDRLAAGDMSALADLTR